MTISPAADQFAPEACLSLLRFHLRQGLKATPLCIAIVAWLCDEFADPSVQEIKLNSDGQVWLRLSDEATLDPLCSFLEFLQQVRVVCQSIGMTGGQLRAMVVWTQQKIG